MKAGLLALVGLLFGAIIWAAPAVVAQGFAGCDDNDPATPCNVTNPSCFNADGTPITDSTLCSGTGRPETQEDNSIFGQNGILTKAARIIAILVGIASVIMIIIGSFQYIIATGDPTNITNAKNTILYAIIGLVVALLAQGIIMFILVRL